MILDPQFHKPNNISSMLKAHGYLMKGLIDDAGSFRHGNVGIFRGDSVKHVAPKASRVPMLMQDLFQFLRKDKETHPIIKSCVFHYELMFIHPFSDGNGRMGRLWQTVLLMSYHEVFKYLPVEQLIKANQQAYYAVLEACDASGESTAFVEFLLQQILDALYDFKNQIKSETHTPMDRLDMAKNHFLKNEFSRKHYMLLHKSISSATASRDLKFGIEKGLIACSGERALTRYRFL